MGMRIREVAYRRNHKLIAAELHGAIVGWLEIFLPLSVLNTGKAEIGALVVDSRCRRRGVGSALMSAARDWAQRKNAPLVYLRSNVKRHDAHQFYRKSGYDVYKTQSVFRLLLEPNKKRKQR